MLASSYAGNLRWRLGLLVKQAVVPVAERLALTHLAPRGLLALRLGPAVQPHAQLLATLVVALKVDGYSATNRQL
jgi:hypothetical protein